ncbi:MAG: ATP-grasp fold amidoligase family protein [Candidatus Moraniibacteriota bacterium]
MKIKLKDFFVSTCHSFLRNTLFPLLPDKQLVAVEYFIAMKKMINLKEPKTFNEKLLWLMLYGGLEKYAKYVDKYEVREFVKETIGEEYLIPMLGVWDNFRDIPFGDLPERFVLKETHGSHYNYICKDKSLINMEKSSQQFSQWLSENYYDKFREIQYKNCKPRIICEQYMEDETGELIDYKFHCFSGEPQLIEIMTEREKSLKIDLRDIFWKNVPFSFMGYLCSDKTLIKPKKLDKMIEIARLLSKNFPYVRVDLYSISDEVYFGELTFTPGNGLDYRFDPPSIDEKFGNLIELSTM